MSSDKQYHCLRGYLHLFNRYWGLAVTDTIICGFSNPMVGEFAVPLPECSFYSIGNFADYPSQKWSDALINVLDNVAEDIFILMLDDYWLTRQADIRAVKMIYDYMHQFKNVIKFDLADERLYVDSGSKYLWGHNTYDTLGYLDLIKSDHASAYHMSLWGGMWRRDLLKELLVPGETAQQIEMNGTYRLGQRGNDLLVLGTRQCPVRHANVIQRGEWNQDATTGLPALKQSDLSELKKWGYVE